jgi:hypothetical protein
MAPANLELVRGIRGAWDRGEFAAVDWAHPQLEFVIADGPTPRFVLYLERDRALTDLGLAAEADASTPG